MQTFYADESMITSLTVLDDKRLGKQRVEAKQILRALRGETDGWANHPATLMWRGYEGALVRYGGVACVLWKHRGFKDSLLPYFVVMATEYPTMVLPPWVGDPEFHRSHQSNLVRKDPAHYRKWWPDVPDDLPYVWPVR